MSWDSYIDSLAGKGLRYSAILSASEGAIWAKSSDFSLSPTEAAGIVNGFKNNDSARASGIYAAGKKYLCLMAEKDQLNGKKGADEGIVCFLSKQCVVIGVYETKDIQGGKATDEVFKMKDYLFSAGY